MENRPPKRETFEQITPYTELVTRDGKKSYPVDIVKEIYIKQDYTLERLADEYNLPKAQLERIARTGRQSWHDLKKEYEEIRLQTLAERHGDTLVDKQSTLQRLEELNLIRINTRIAELEEHYKKWGDFFARTPTGDIMRNAKGQAIELSFPMGKDEVLLLKILGDVKEENAVKIMMRKRKQQEDTQTIDAESYGLFLDDKTNK